MCLRYKYFVIRFLRFENRTKGTSFAFLIYLALTTTTFGSSELASPVPASPEFLLSESMDAVPFGKYTSILVDDEKKLTIEDVSRPEYDAKFVAVKKDSLALGFTDAAYWIRLRVKNPESREIKWYLEQRNPRIDRIELYRKLENGSYEQETSGLIRPVSERRIKSRIPIFVLSENPSGDGTYYLRFESSGTILISLIGSTPEEYVSTAILKEAFLWFFYGIVAVMILYNVFLYFSLKEIDYIYYVLMAISLLFVFLGDDAITFAYFGKIGLFLTNNQPLLGLITSFFAIQFAASYLSIAKDDGILYKIIYVYKLSFIPSSILVLAADYSTAVQFSNFVGIVTIILLFNFAVVKSLRNYRPAKLYLLSFMICLFGLLLLLFRTFGFVPDNFITAYSGRIGVVVTFVLLSISVGDKIKEYERDANKTLKFALEQLNETNLLKENFLHSLEEKVKEKTSQLKESEARYRALIDLSPDGIAILSEGKFVFINPAGATMLGARSPDELLGRSSADVIHPRFRRAAERRYVKSINSKTKVQFNESSLLLNDGTPVYLEASIMKIHFNGKPSLLIYGRDIKQRMQSESELKKLSQAIEYSPVSIVITDRKGRIEFANPKFLETTGYTKEEVMGKNPRVLKSGYHSPDFYKHLWNTLKLGRTWRGTFYNKKKNGEFYWERASISPVVGPRGTTHFIAVKEDITELQRLETMKEDTERIMRHDMNNSLSSIIGFSELLLGEKSIEPEKREWIELINSCANNLSVMINNYMAIYKMEEGTYKLNAEIFNLFSLFSELAMEFRSLLKTKQCRLNYRFNEEKMDFEKNLNISGEKLYLKILFENLVVNAIQASPENSEITVYVKTGEKFHSIEIHNLGEIPKEIQSTFFEKYTTSGKKEGNGLGTYSAKLIAKVHGGDISFTSSQENGTRLTVVLPAV